MAAVRLVALPARSRLSRLVRVVPVARTAMQPQQRRCQHSGGCASKAAPAPCCTQFRLHMPIHQASRPPAHSIVLAAVLSWLPRGNELSLHCSLAHTRAHAAMTTYMHIDGGGCVCAIAHAHTVGRTHTRRACKPACLHACSLTHLPWRRLSCGNVAISGLQLALDAAKFAEKTGLQTRGSAAGAAAAAGAAGSRFVCRTASVCACVHAHALAIGTHSTCHSPCPPHSCTVRFTIAVLRSIYLRISLLGVTFGVTACR
jgi:hypothetical protein